MSYWQVCSAVEVLLLAPPPAAPHVPHVVNVADTPHDTVCVKAEL